MHITMDDLEIPCWDCQGTGEVDSGQEGKVPCVKCNGTGVVLTAMGQTLLAFIKKHINL